MVPGRRAWWARARRGSRSATRGSRGRPRRLAHRRAAAAARLPAPAGDRRDPEGQVQHQLDYDGLHVEHLSWQLPYGPPTEAVVLEAGRCARDGFPPCSRLHDHGGNKYFGWRKIAQISDELHPMMKEHRDEYYGGVSWANELAKRGFAVLVHDAFAFASRRVRAADLPAGDPQGSRRRSTPSRQEEIKAYNSFAADHENLMAKSLFCAGTTWPGVFTAEDQRALDYLCSRDDVDPARVGCGGLSGGGLRTVYLGGLDDRIRCACCVGMMTTWRDYLLNKCHTHTWMIYIPGLPPDLDYPEILGLRVPLPTLVLNDNEDQLFTIGEMRRADRILAEVYAKAGAGDRLQGLVLSRPAQVRPPMQAEAFAWFERWLKA